MFDKYDIIFIHFQSSHISTDNVKIVKAETLQQKVYLYQDIFVPSCFILSLPHVVCLRPSFVNIEHRLRLSLVIQIKGDDIKFCSASYHSVKQTAMTFVNKCSILLLDLGY